MRQLHLLFLALPPLLLACTSTQVVDETPDGRAILIRGALPDAQSLKNLHTLHGLKTIVNLRGEQPNKSWYRDEARGAEAIGARIVNLRVGGRDAPPPEAVASFFDLVEDDSNWPILVHCQAGMHRTGLVVALYRMQYDGWTPEQAIREMEQHGFDLTRADRSKVKTYLRGYRPDPARKLP